MHQKMNPISFEKTTHILESMTIKNHIDSGLVEHYQGTHPMLGAIVLVIDNTSGTGVLIK